VTLLSVTCLILELVIGSNNVPGVLGMDVKTKDE